MWGARLFRPRWLLVLMLALVAAPALAQAPPSAPAPPMPSQIDEHGVDLISGRLVTGATDLDIGPDDHRGLRFTRQWSKSGWRIADIPVISGSTNNPIVSFGGQSIPFTLVAGVYKPAFEDGSTLNSARTTFTASDGTQIAFAAAYNDLTMDSNLGLGSQIIYPDGTLWTYHYETKSTTIGPAFPPECSVPPLSAYWQNYCGIIYTQWQAYNVQRLSSITSSTGYQIKLTYQTDVLTWENQSAWWYVAKATAINNAVEYCTPTSAACTLSNLWPQVTYSNWVGGRIDSVTATVDPGVTRTTVYSYGTSSLLTGIKAPGDSTNAITYGYDASGRVSSVTAGGGTWSYSYVTGATTVTSPSPGSAVRTINYDGTGFMTSSVAGGLTTQYAPCLSTDPNCPEGLLKTVTAPEGNKVTHGYDARGNVTSTTYSPKLGGGAAITTSAAYPASCTNAKTCNKPTSTTDARGQVTNYEYSSTHGGVTLITQPAPTTGGATPQVRITYSPVAARYLSGPGSWTNSSAIYVPSAVSSCRVATAANPASCVGTADERVTAIVYPANTTPNNLQPVSVTTRAGNGTLAATSTPTYDAYGRVLTVDGPLAGSGDTTRYRYNLAGQVLGEISPDPDGAGTLPHLATRYSYNARGQLYLTQSGTVANQSDSAWNAFAVTAQSTTEFDTYGRPVRQKAQGADGTAHQVVDTVYDTASRVQCTIVRMNPAQWGTVASNCTPNTSGSYGPDRVTYNHYDALDRVWKVTTAYGITGQAADEQVRTFTPNGQLWTVKDANNNLTTYEYDGFDRLRKTRFPVPTQGANASSTTDYEEVGYDNNGNVTSFRTRAGHSLTLTYDNVNRMTLKQVPEHGGIASAYTRDVYYGYDLFDDLLYARFDSHSGEGVSFTYDALGQMITERTHVYWLDKTLSYQYDANGNRTRITHPDGNYFQYVRDGLGRLDSTTVNGNPLFHPTRDNAGRVTGLYRWNPAIPGWGPNTGFAQDAIGRLSSQSSSFNTSSYNSTTTFAYNPASQIASATRTNDAYAWTAHANANRGYTPNGLNQYAQVAGTSFGYDANGNLGSDGSRIFGYDVENRLTVLNYGSGEVPLYYDPLGRLAYTNDAATMNETRFLYSGDDLVAEYSGSGTLLRRYVHGDGAGDDPLVWFEGATVANSARRYLFGDERGSIVAVTDSAGNVLSVNRYDEYGLPGTANSGRFQYTGQAWIPELGMYHYKARMYSPSLGRFMQTDPIGYGDGMNMYAYTGNDPVNGVDPTGMVDTEIVVTAERWRGPFIDTSAGRGIPGGGNPLYAMCTVGNLKCQSDIDNYLNALARALNQVAHQAEPQKEQQSVGPCPPTSAGNLATAVGHANTAHSAFENIADIEGGGRYLRPTGVVGGVVSSTATAFDSAARGETMDVTFARIVLPTIGGIAGGTLGAVAGTALGGPLGGAALGFGGGVAGAELGTRLANWIAADAPRPRGCR